MNTTIGISSFMREPLTQRLVKSIRGFYPDIRVLIADDSSRKFNWVGEKNTVIYNLPYDAGLSAKRNKLVRECKTKFLFLLDNDYIFTERTKIEDAEVTLLNKQVDLLGLASIENGKEISYNGYFETDGGSVKYIKSEDKLHFVGNFFIAKTDKLREFTWDNGLKMGEHFAYFYTHRDKLKIGYTNKISAIHQHDSCPDSSGYDVFRNRAEMYVKKFMSESGITKRIDLNGNIITS